MQQTRHKRIPRYRGVTSADRGAGLRRILIRDPPLNAAVWLRVAEGPGNAGRMILLRHGQSEFNLRFTATRRDPGIEDARLTEYGHHQAEDAARKLASEPITRIIASPYTRALQTAEPLARLLGLKIEIRPVVRERFGLPCDIGTVRSRLTSAWPAHDFSHIEEKWWPDEHETPDAVTGRAKTFRDQMVAEPDWPETVVVSHWGFILCMTGQSIANGETIRCDPTGPIPEQLIWRA